MKKYKKVIITISIIIMIILIGYISLINIIKHDEEINSIAVNTRNNYTSVNTMGLTEEITNFDNSSYAVIEDKNIKLEYYFGDADCVVIPEKIGDFTVKEVNTDAFKYCNNLEAILISTSVINDVDEIIDFEKNEEESNDQYLVYTTTKKYNPVYLRYASLDEEERATWEVIPSKFLIPTAIDKSNEVTNIPESFDLRKENGGPIEIEVENQGSFGICYAYATLTAVETNIALNYKDDNDNGIIKDFSEVHLAIFTDQIHGGFFETSCDYFRRWNGPMEIEGWNPDQVLHQGIAEEGIEEDGIYKMVLNHFTQNKPLSNAEKDQFSNAIGDVKNEYIVTETRKIYSDDKQLMMDEMKKSIQTNGALYVCIGSPKDENISFYNGSILLNNKGNWQSKTHAVAIVGYDDNFSKNNFSEEIRPENDGAWLALNSWGENWSDGGYFWISYDDNSVYNDVRSVVEVSDDLTKINFNNLEENKDYNLIFKNDPQDDGKWANRIKIDYKGEILVNDLDFIVEYDIHNNVITYTLTGIGGFEGTIVKDLPLPEEYKQNISDMTLVVEDENFIYDGNEKKPKVTIFDRDKELIENTDFKVFYSNNINAGEGTILINGIGNYGGVATTNFVIEKGIPTYEVPTGIRALYGTKLIDVELPSNFYWECRYYTLVGNIGKNVFTCKYMPEDNTNYNIVTGIEVTVEVYDDLEIINYTLENNVIKNIQPNTYYVDFTKNIITNESYSVREGSTIILENIKIKTGQTLIVGDNSYTLVVNGDTNGDGNADIKDILKINKHRLNIEQLREFFLEAGDANGDGKVDIKDILRINKFRLGIINEL